MSCAICDSDSFAFLFEKNACRIEKCLICGLVQVTDIASTQQVEQLYDVDFFERYYDDLESNQKKQRYVYLNFSNKLDQIEKRFKKKRGKILDVGCSFGFFLDVARQRGWGVEGIDVSKYAADYARQRLGLSVINKPIMEADHEEKSFDVITMWYVVEHLSNPKQDLRRLSTFLKDEGILVVSTSNVDSFRAKVYGKKWFIPPVHLLFFSPKTIRSLFKECYFHIIDQELAFPYEKYLRKYKLFNLLNKIKLGDNIVYYAQKLGGGSQTNFDT